MAEMAEMPQEIAPEDCGFLHLIGLQPGLSNLLFQSNSIHLKLIKPWQGSQA